MLQLHYPINSLYWNWSGQSCTRTLCSGLLSDNSHVSVSEKSWHFSRRTCMILTSRVADQHLQTKTFSCQCTPGIQATGHTWVTSKFTRGEQQHIGFPPLGGKNLGKIIAEEGMSQTQGWRWRISTGLLQGKEIKKEMAGPDKNPSPPSCQTGGFCFRNRWEENPLHG